MIHTVIIFGANGMLGRYMTSYFSKKTEYKVIPIKRNDFDITEKTILLLDSFLESYHMDEHTCVINCIGFIPQKEKVQSNSNYYTINSIFPQYLSKVCNKYKSKLICPTTDCVFNGKKGNYIETDFADETNMYGISKSLGEPADATVIRVSIIGEERNNPCSFLEFVKNSKGIINGWDNHMWNGITCFQYCKVVDQIIQSNLFWKGVRHLYSPDRRSKYELACIIKEVYHLPCEINQYHAPIIVDKTLSSIYDTSLLFSIPSLEIQIKEQSTFTI